MASRDLLTAGSLVSATIGLLALALWLQAPSGSAVAAPEVRIVAVRSVDGALAPGEVATVAAVLRSEGAPLRDLTVELEVRGEAGQLYLRAPRRGIGLSGGQEQTVSWVWRLPESLPPGDYAAVVSVYGVNWSPLYARQPEPAVLLVRTR